MRFKCLNGICWCVMEGGEIGGVNGEVRSGSEGTVVPFEGEENGNSVSKNTTCLEM